MLTNKQRKKVLGVIVGRDDCDFSTAKMTYDKMSEDECVAMIPDSYAPMTNYEIKHRLEMVGRDLNLIGIVAYLGTSGKGGPILKINTKQGPEVSIVYFANDDLYKIFVGGGHYKTSADADEIINAVDFVVFG